MAIEARETLEEVLRLLAGWQSSWAEVLPRESTEKSSPCKICWQHVRLCENRVNWDVCAVADEMCRQRVALRALIKWLVCEALPDAEGSFGFCVPATTQLKVAFGLAGELSTAKEFQNNWFSNIYKSNVRF